MKRKHSVLTARAWPGHVAHSWCCCRQVDTFEAVKNNVYAMLGELAQDFDGNQMDLLFNKFEACSSLASRQTDTMKVMNLVQQLAVSDSKVGPAELATCILHACAQLLRASACASWTFLTHALDPPCVAAGITWVGHRVSASHLHQQGMHCALPRHRQHFAKHR